MIKIDELWRNCLEKLSAECPTTVIFEVWINTLEAVCVVDNKLVLLSPSAAAKNLIYKNYIDMINGCVHNVNPLISEVIIIVEGEKEDYLKKQSEELNGEFLVRDESQKENISSTFTAKYTFDSFVVGNSNKFAFAAAKAVSDNPGEKYNPLFIYGGVGLGKTHLMHAIGNSLRKNKPNLKVLYVPTEKFIDEMVYALRNSKERDLNREFREKYRNVDVLMLDDIQFLAGKAGTQEAIFHTFNDLFQNGKQIIISSDRPPKEISTLEERLRTRFEWGLIADIESPDLETRIAILQKKAEQESYLVGDDVIKFIAERIENNIREMEGLLSKVMFYSQLIGKPAINVEVAREALKDYIGENKNYVIDMDLIIDSVCSYFKTSREELTGKKRNKEIVEPRMICTYLITDILPEIPLSTIGAALGGRDHTTVIHSRDKITEQLKTSKRIQNLVKDIEDIIMKR